MSFYGVERERMLIAMAMSWEGCYRWGDRGRDLELELELGR